VKALQPSRKQSVVKRIEDPIIIVPYDVRWPGHFRRTGMRLRWALGPVARRIDHVGSTSVRSLDAKPVIDVQVSVTTLEPSEPFLRPLEAVGYGFMSANPDRTKRLFLQAPGAEATHIHARPNGSFDEQLNLLLRDYHRGHSDAARDYARTKWELAEPYRNDRAGDVRAKEPTIWSLLKRAHDWAHESGRVPGPSDA
jgi:GrpB-like predicted nucleotidyltransferase (UPF0157 family)